MAVKNSCSLILWVLKSWLQSSHTCIFAIRNKGQLFHKTMEKELTLNFYICESLTRLSTEDQAQNLYFWWKHDRKQKRIFIFHTEKLRQVFLMIFCKTVSYWKKTKFKITDNHFKKSFFNFIPEDWGFDIKVFKWVKFEWNNEYTLFKCVVFNHKTATFPSLWK